MNALAEFLVERKVATAADIERALGAGGGQSQGLGTALYAAGHANAEALTHALAEFHRTEIAKPEEFNEPPEVGLAPGFLRANKIFPLSDGPAGLVLAMADPGDEDTIGAVRLTIGKPVIAKAVYTY